MSDPLDVLFPKPPKREKKQRKGLVSKTPLKPGGRVRVSQRKLERQAEYQEFVNAHMARMKKEPCFIDGTRGNVEVAHIWLPKRGGLRFQKRIERTLDRTATSHKGVAGLYCIPLENYLHSEQSEYEYSYHKIGQEAFFKHHGITPAEVYAFVVMSIADTYLEGWNA